MVRSPIGVICTEYVLHRREEQVMEVGAGGFVPWPVGCTYLRRRSPLCRLRPPPTGDNGFAMPLSRYAVSIQALILDFTLCKFRIYKIICFLKTILNRLRHYIVIGIVGSSPITPYYRNGYFRILTHSHPIIFCCIWVSVIKNICKDNGIDEILGPKSNSWKDVRNEYNKYIKHVTKLKII